MRKGCGPWASRCFPAAGCCGSSASSFSSRGGVPFSPPPLELGYASRTMRWGGVIILLYVIYHLLHLTFGSVHPDFVVGEVYHNLVTGFQVWPVTAAYVVATA